MRDYLADYGFTPFKGPDPTKRYNFFGREIPARCHRGGGCWKRTLLTTVIGWRNRGEPLADLHERVTHLRHDWNRNAPDDCLMCWDEVDAELDRLLAMKDQLPATIWEVPR